MNIQGVLKGLAKQKWIKRLKLIIPILVLGLIYLDTKEMLASINPKQLYMTLRSFLNPKDIRLIFLGLASVLMMSIYDLIIVRHLGLPLRFLTVLHYSFLSSTVDNVSGMGAISGAYIRSSFIDRSNQPKGILLDYNFLFIPSAIVGLSFYAVLVFFNKNLLKTMFHNYDWLIWVVIGFIGYGVVFFFLDKIQPYWKHNKRVTFARRILARTELFAASILCWLTASLFFVLIAYVMTQNTQVFYLSAIFMLGAMVGDISMVPGGVGSFDMIVLFGLGTLGIKPEIALTIIILYRILMFYLPLLFSVVLSFLVVTTEKILQKRPRFQEQMQAIDRQILSVMDLLLVVAISGAGIVLALQNLRPILYYSLELPQGIAQLPILHFYAPISLWMGLLLIAFARELNHRMKQAYWIVIALLVMGILFSLVLSFSLEIVLYLSILFSILIFLRPYFDRSQRPISQEGVLFTLFLMLLMAVFSLFASHYLTIGLLSNLSDQLESNYQLARKIRVTITVYLLAAFFYVGYRYQSNFNFPLRRKRHP